MSKIVGRKIFIYIDIYHVYQVCYVYEIVYINKGGAKKIFVLLCKRFLFCVSTFIIKRERGFDDG